MTRTFREWVTFTQTSEQMPGAEHCVWAMFLDWCEEREQLLAQIAHLTTQPAALPGEEVEE